MDQQIAGRRRLLLLVAGALAVTSLGLPWGAPSPAPGVAPTVSGAQHPVRVIGLVAALLLVSAVRAGSTGRARTAVGLGALALPLGLAGGIASGPAVYTVALLLSAVATGALSRDRADRSGPGPRPAPDGRSAPAAPPATQRPGRRHPPGEPAARA